MFRRSYRDSNSRPLDHESGAFTNTLARPTWIRRFYQTNLFSRVISAFLDEAFFPVTLSRSSQMRLFFFTAMVSRPLSRPSRGVSALVSAIQRCRFSSLLSRSASGACLSYSASLLSRSASGACLSYSASGPLRRRDKLSRSRRQPNPRANLAPRYSTPIFLAPISPSPPAVPRSLQSRRPAPGSRGSTQHRRGTERTERRK